MGRRFSRLFWVAMAALAFRACVFEPVRMTDDSMTPLLSDGDVAFVSKLRYGLRVPGAGTMLLEWSKPKKGDLVVVVSVGDPPVNLMRRISAVPGDQVTLPDGKVTTLPKGEYFVRASQPDDGWDSRKFGPVPRQSIIGKVTHTWLAKNPSKEEGSKVESQQSNWRVLQPIL
jgi:signal peptidase I